MKRRFPAALLALLLLPHPSPAQDAHSVGIGFATSASPLGAFGLFWNPSLLGLPSGEKRPKPWTVGSGFTVLDSSNSGEPILRFDDEHAFGSGKDPVLRRLANLGAFVVKYVNTAGGILYQKNLDYRTSRDSLAFFRDRDSASISGSYDLDLHEIEQQIAHVVLGYGTILPFGTMPVFVGANLKYHNGLDYRRTTLEGDFVTGSSGADRYSKDTSTSGLGLSVDFGFLAKFSQILQVGMMFENIQSNFDWEVTRRNYTLDTVTGAETLDSTTTFTLKAPFPYATKLGAVMAPQGKNILLMGEVAWVGGQTRWRGGFERYYPETHLVVRFGTYADETSNDQLWTFGGGYLDENIAFDLALVTRSLPAVQDSIALGGAASASVRF